MTEDADRHLADTLLGVLVRPRATFAAMATQRSARPGASAIALLGMLWGLLCFLLWSGRHAPHAVFVPLPPQDYYLYQGLTMLPVLTALWWLFSEVAHRLAGGEGTEAATRAALGFAYAVPMSVHVSAELIAYAVAGFDALGRTAMISMPLASLWVLGLSARALHVLHAISPRRAFWAAFAGLLVQALVGALILR